jgi:hypothetical protein
MNRRRGEITGHQNERDFPHIVELPLPPGGFRGQSDALKNFYARYPATAKERAAPGDHGGGTDEASRPVRRHVAIGCPVP